MSGNGKDVACNLYQFFSVFSHFSVVFFVHYKDISFSVLMQEYGNNDVLTFIHPYPLMVFTIIENPSHVYDATSEGLDYYLQRERIFPKRKSFPIYIYFFIYILYPLKLIVEKSCITLLHRYLQAKSKKIKSNSISRN